MPMVTQNVTFIVPTLNEAEHIGTCIQSILGLSLPPMVSGIEIIVVDNGSTDDTVSISRTLGARVISLPPGTISTSRNVGTRLGGGDWFAFVDADCALPRNWLTLAAEHWSMGKLAAFGTPVAMPPTDAPWVEKTWFHLGHPRHGRDWQEVQWLPTFNLLVSRSAFENVSGFDESLTTCEDSDLGYRLGKVGRLVLDARTSTRHFRESKSLADLFRREGWRGQGNWRGFRSHALNFSELPSLVAPVAYVGLLTASLATLLGSAFHASLLRYCITALLLSQTLPVAYMIRHSTFKHRFAEWFRAWLLANVYFLARGISFFASFKR